MIRFFLPLILFFVVVVFLTIGLNLDPKEVPSPLINKKAPEFVLTKLHNNNKFNSKSFSGKVWVLNVWASWCVSCRVEHQYIKKLANSISAPVIGLNYKDKNIDASQWLEQFGNPYDFSVVDSNGKVGIDWGVYGVPETFVIDKQGLVIYKQIGPVDKKSLNETILPLISKIEKM